MNPTETIEQKDDKVILTSITLNGNVHVTEGRTLEDARLAHFAWLCGGERS